MKLAINQNTLQTALDSIIKSVLGLAAATTLLGIGYYGTQVFGSKTMLVTGGAISTLGLFAQLAQPKVPKQNPFPQRVEVGEEDEEEVI
jgi:hypothetical protein